MSKNRFAVVLVAFAISSVLLPSLTLAADSPVYRPGDTMAFDTTIIANSTPIFDVSVKAYLVYGWGDRQEVPAQYVQYVTYGNAINVKVSMPVDSKMYPGNWSLIVEGDWQALNTEPIVQPPAKCLGSFFCFIIPQIAMPHQPRTLSYYDTVQTGFVVENPGTKYVSMDLPAHTFSLGTWYSPFTQDDGSSGGGYYSSTHIESNQVAGNNYYGQQWYVVWRVATDSNGNRILLDSYTWDGHAATGSTPQQTSYSYGSNGYSSWGTGPSALYWAEQTVPAKTVKLPEGYWTIQLVQAAVPTAAVDHLSGALNQDTVLDMWAGVPVNYYHYSTNSWSYNGNYGYTKLVNAGCTNATKAAYDSTGKMGAESDITSYFEGYQVIWGRTQQFDTVSSSCSAQNLNPMQDLGCNFDYSFNGMSQSSGSSSSLSQFSGNSCWIETKTAPGVSVKSLGNVVETWTLEPPSHVSILDVKACGDRDCKEAASTMAKSQIWLVADVDASRNWTGKWTVNGVHLDGKEAALWNPMETGNYTVVFVAYDDKGAYDSWSADLAIVPFSAPYSPFFSGGGVTVGPFSGSTGQKANNDNAAAAASVIAVGAALAGGAYLLSRAGASAFSNVRRSGQSSGWSVTDTLTDYGRALAGQLNAARNFVAERKQAYEAWLAEMEAKSLRNKQQAVLSDRANQLQADLAKIQNSKNYADAGSAYAALASKYSDILTDSGKKQLIAVSNAAWNANATATAPSIVTASLAQQALAENPDDPLVRNRIVSKNLYENDGEAKNLVDTSANLDKILKLTDAPSTTVTTANAAAQITGKGTISKFIDHADDVLTKVLIGVGILKLTTDVEQVGYATYKGDAYDKPKSITLITEDIEGVGQMAIEAVATDAIIAGTTAYMALGSALPVYIDMPGLPKMQTIITAGNGQSMSL